MQNQITESLLTAPNELSEMTTDSQPVSSYSKPTGKQAKHAFISMVNKLVAFRAQGRLTEDEFREIIAYVCSVYLEFSLENRLQKAFGKSWQRSLSFSDQ